MDDSQHLNTFAHFTNDEIKNIYLPVSFALTILYLPIFFLSIFNRYISKIFKWILAIPIIIYILIIPSFQPFRSIPVYNICIASIAVYYAQKIVEWMFIRQKEFNYWSFFDIHHELFYYRVYTLPISIKKFKKKKIKREIFHYGHVPFDRQLKSLIYLSCRTIQYYLIMDLFIFYVNQVFSTEFYQTYYQKFLGIQIIVNQLAGSIVYLLMMFNYEIFRYMICLTLNRPLNLIPELFQQPYRAISPSDFWLRWHQIYKSTWIEIIYKPISKFVLYCWPCAPKLFVYGISSLSVFVFSGLVHEYSIYITSEKFTGDQTIFFVVQGLAVCTEHIIKRQCRGVKIPTLLSFLSTFLFNGITAGYFIRPWIPYFIPKQAFKYSLMNLLVRNLSDQY